MTETSCKPPYCTCGEHLLADNPGPPDIDWCYLPGCDKHPSPTGEPKDPRPNIGQLRQYQNRVFAWHTKQGPRPTPEIQVEIIDLVETAENFYELWSAYKLAEVANMVYFELSDKKNESEWIWI